MGVVGDEKRADLGVELRKVGDFCLLRAVGLAGESLDF